MPATKPYIGPLRARPGPSSEHYAERDYYCWRMLMGARKYGLTYAQAVELCCKVFTGDWYRAVIAMERGHGLTYAQAGELWKVFAKHGDTPLAMTTAQQRHGLTYAQAVELCKVFKKHENRQLAKSTVQGIYRKFGGAQAVKRATDTSPNPPEPFEVVENEVLKHTPKLHGRLRRGST